MVSIFSEPVSPGPNPARFSLFLPVPVVQGEQSEPGISCPTPAGQALFNGFLLKAFLLRTENSGVFQNCYVSLPLAGSRREAVQPLKVRLTVL